MPDNCSGCAEGGVCYCEDVGGDTTQQHNACWVRISDLAAHGGLVGLGCDVGCDPCYDQPGELLRSAASLPPGGPSPVAPRFMESVSQDDRGKLHDLKSGHPRLVQQYGRYRRGACSQVGFGTLTECLGEEDTACSCWHGAAEMPGPDSTCDGVGIGGVVRGRVKDGILYKGGWPAELACRKFPEPAVDEVAVWSPTGNTIFIRSATEKDGCCADWLVPGAAYVEHSDCKSGYIHPWTDEGGTHHPGHAGQTYIENVATAYENLFDKVAVGGSTAAFCSRTGVDTRDVAVRNAVLARILASQGFPDPRRPRVRIKFDLLDHEVSRSGNHHLGRYSRSWDGRTFDIADAHLPVVRRATFPASRTKYGEPVTAELVITKVWVVMDLTLNHTMQYTSAQPGGWPTRFDFIEPHAVVRMMAWLGLRVTIDGDSEAVYTEGDCSRWPTLTRPHNGLLLAQEPGEYWQPPAYVEWCGVCDNHSEPTLADQGFPQVVGDSYFVHNTGYGPVLYEAATALGAWEVGARPVLRESQPDDAQQMWTGSVSFSFVGTPGYVICPH